MSKSVEGRSVGGVVKGCRSKMWEGCMRTVLSFVPMA